VGLIKKVNYNFSSYSLMKSMRLANTMQRSLL
jgi:hypothetical protein